MSWRSFVFSLQNKAETSEPDLFACSFLQKGNMIVDAYPGGKLLSHITQLFYHSVFVKMLYLVFVAEGMMYWGFLVCHAYDTHKVL